MSSDMLTSNKKLIQPSPVKDYLGGCNELLPQCSIYFSTWEKGANLLTPSYWKFQSWHSHISSQYLGALLLKSWFDFNPIALRKAKTIFLDHDIIFYFLNNVEKIHWKFKWSFEYFWKYYEKWIICSKRKFNENLSEVLNTFENIMKNGAFAPKEQMLHFPYFQIHISKVSKRCYFGVRVKNHFSCCHVIVMLLHMYYIKSYIMRKLINAIFIDQILSLKL